MEFLHGVSNAWIVANAGYSAQGRRNEVPHPDINFEQLDELFLPYPAEKMVAYSISKRFNAKDVLPDDAQVLAGYTYDLPEVPSIVSVKGTDLLCC